MAIGRMGDARAQRLPRLARGRPMPSFWGVACAVAALIVAVRIAIAAGQFHPVVVLPLIPHP